MLVIGNVILQNSIMILDEAHNINKVCEEAASVSLLSSDIALAINEVTQVFLLIYLYIYLISLLATGI